MLQAALDKDKSSDGNDISSADCSNDLPQNIASVVSDMNGLSLSEIDSLVTPPSKSTECSAPVDQVQDIDKKIRALKKKVICILLQAIGISLLVQTSRSAAFLFPTCMPQILILSLKHV